MAYREDQAELSLPMIDGFRPEAWELSISGSIKDPDAQPDRVMQLGDQMQLVIVGSVVHVGQKIDLEDGSSVRQVKFKALEARVLPESIHERVPSAAADESPQPSLLPHDTSELVAPTIEPSAALGDPPPDNPAGFYDTQPWADDD